MTEPTNQPQQPASDGFFSHLVVSSSPHFHTGHTVTSIMLWVIIALLPACAAGVYFFGLSALRVLIFTTAFCVALEYLSSRCMKRSNELGDLSAVVTGLLLGMNLPSGTPWWICLIGALMAIVFGKMIYGGLGCNPFNPALVGRVALLLAFPAVMTTWPMARSCSSCTQEPPPVHITTSATPGKIQTHPTPLKFSKDTRSSGQAAKILELATPKRHPVLTYTKLFLGYDKGGSLGETCSLALLIGGVLLIYLNIVRWQIPLCYIGTVLLITGIAHLVNPAHYAHPLYHLLTGGLLLGAFFMATDMVTTPLSRLGAIVFGIGCGVFTACIRLWGSYPEGVSFSILIMNAFTPLIDRYTAGRPFGMPRKKGVNLKEAQK